MADYYCETVGQSAQGPTKRGGTNVATVETQHWSPNNERQTPMRPKWRERIQRGRRAKLRELANRV